MMLLDNAADVFVAPSVANDCGQLNKLLNSSANLSVSQLEGKSFTKEEGDSDRSCDNM